MNNLNEAIKFIKDKLDEPDVKSFIQSEYQNTLEHILDLLIKTKTDFRNVQHKAYRAERSDD